MSKLHNQMFNAEYDLEVKTVKLDFIRQVHFKVVAHAVAQKAFTLYGNSIPVSLRGQLPPGYDGMMITKTMLDSVQNSMVVSLEFLTFTAVHGSPILETFAAMHVNTPSVALSHIVQTGDYDMIPSMAVYKALFNPHTPFKDVLVGWHKIDPEMVLKDSPALLEREEEYVELLAQHDLTLEEAEALPPEWLIKTLFDNTVNGKAKRTYVEGVVA